jgi:type II secretory pathway component PulF
MGRNDQLLSRLGFLLRQKLPLIDALEVLVGDSRDPAETSAIRTLLDRIQRGDSLSSALSTLPPPFPREVLPLIEEMEARGLLPEDLEALGVWSAEGEAGQLPVARILAHASILLRQGRTISEALTSALRPGDPEAVKAAVAALARAATGPDSLAEAMGRFPEIYSPGAQRIVLQMERNGNAETTFRDLALALSRGWFLPGRPRAAP